MFAGVYNYNKILILGRLVAKMKFLLTKNSLNYECLEILFDKLNKQYILDTFEKKIKNLTVATFFSFM